MWSPSLSWLMMCVLVAKVLQQHYPGAPSFTDCAQGHPSLNLPQPSSVSCYNRIQPDQDGDHEDSTRLRDVNGVMERPEEGDASRSLTCYGANKSVLCQGAPAALPELQEDRHEELSKSCRRNQQICRILHNVHVHAT